MIGFSRCLAVGAALGLVLGCGSSDTPNDGAGGTSAGGNTGGSGSPGAGAPSNAGAPPVSTSTAAELATKLGRPTNFLIGLGNDLANDHAMDGAYTLGTTLDLHYAYLVGLLGQGGWPDWNPGGQFVNVLTDTAAAKGVTPMFTMYSMAARGEANLNPLASDSYMKPYLEGLKLMYQRIGAFDKPAVVHFEPDFWAFAQQQSKGDAASVKVNLSNNAPECAGLGENLVGFGNCMVKLARMYAPKALVGFHASSWAGDPATTVAFLNSIGADKGDVVFSDLLDRDAGCFEAGVDPACMGRGTDGFYWDETNQSSPNFHEFLAWSKAISSGVGRPMIWWQIPLGVPSSTKGGAAGKYRDNRVHYIFSHIQEFVDAGGLGATFGTGASNQTTIETDGGQFKNAVAAYYKAPVALP